MAGTFTRLATFVLKRPISRLRSGAGPLLVLALHMLLAMHCSLVHGQQQGGGGQQGGGQQGGGQQGG